MSKSTNEVGRVFKNYCSKCLGDKNCEIVAYYKESGVEDDYYYWSKDWYTIKCRGCDHVFLKTVSTNSEDMDYLCGSDGEPLERYFEVVDYWPPLSKKEKPDWMSHDAIESDISKVDILYSAINEVYLALDANLYSLSAIGVRTAFDVAAGLLGIDDNLSFEKKLSELVSRQLIRDDDRNNLATIIDGGNASVHRGWKPSSEDLNTMVAALEDFVFQAFVKPYRQRQSDKRIETLREKVPKRARLPRSTPGAVKVSEE